MSIISAYLGWAAEGILDFALLSCKLCAGLQRGPVRCRDVRRKDRKAETKMTQSSPSPLFSSLTLDPLKLI